MLREGAEMLRALIVVLLFAGSGSVELPDTVRVWKPGRAEKRPFIEITVDRAGETRLKGAAIAADALVAALATEADGERDVDHPLKPSKRPVLIRADARAPWKSVLGVVDACLHREVRLWKLYWAARSAETGKEVRFPIFFPMDHSLARTMIRLTGKPVIAVFLERPEGEELTRVWLLGSELGLGDEAFEKLRSRAEEILARRRDAPAEILVDDSVSFGDVLRAWDAFPDHWRSSDLGITRQLGPWPAGLDELARALSPDLSRKQEVEKLLREAFPGQTPPLEGPGDEFWGEVARKGGYAAAAKAYAALLVPDPQDRSHVGKTLLRQEWRLKQLEELLGKIRKEPAVLSGLARAYIEEGRAEGYLRALTLLGILVRADPRRSFSRQWWYWQYLILRIYCEYGEKRKDRTAIKNTLQLVKAFEELDALRLSPHREQIVELRDRAAAMQKKLEKK
jgi:biopolymer transport protein ExbD